MSITFENPEQWREISEKIALGLLPCPNCGRWCDSLLEVPDFLYRAADDWNIVGAYYWTAHHAYYCCSCLSDLYHSYAMRNHKKCSHCENMYLVLRDEYDELVSSVGSFICPSCRKDISDEKIRSDIAKKEKYKVTSQNSRTQKFNLVSDLSISEWMDLLDFHEWKCVYCGGEYTDMDHVVPVLHGGGTTKNNVVPACRKCNSKKRASGETPQEIAYLRRHVIKVE